MALTGVRRSLQNLCWGTVVVIGMLPTLVDAKPSIFMGNKALETCRKDPNWCYSYSMAIVETASGMNSPEAQFCLPDNASGGQIKDLFVQTLEGTPALRHEPAIYLFMMKLVELYPCP